MCKQLQKDKTRHVSMQNIFKKCNHVTMATVYETVASINCDGKQV